MPYIYLSVDIETDGPIPGEFSMISLGAAAFLQDGSSSTPFATFEINITPIPGAKTDPKTMSWWNTQPEAWSHIHQEPIREPADAMQAFASWIESLPGCMNSPPGLTTPGTFFVGPTKIIFVGYPATFDHMFVYWYWVKFLGTAPPFGFQGLDLKSYASAKLNLPFPQTTKRNMPKTWFTGSPKHTHTPLQDAIGQGVLFLNMLRLPAR